ncbi:TonB family protein [Bradyrhizobium sp. dw_78]|uniref:TonB family protein n=1 Tax=Bradyrhizobium sp. dw_78 TaxID=2719793 RepID=UPI001BD264E9|nr:TonB family protein [Bradyrhizobium sp. dw_78]
MSDLVLEQKPSRRLWILAAVGALALHLGGAALAVAHMSSDDGDDSLGANAVEVGVELESPHVEDSDLPPGPDADASVASPALAEQKAEIKPTDLPQDTPDESEDPDRVVTENQAKKPTEDDPKVETVQTAASQESVAQEATARQTLEDSRESEAVKAPNLGIGKDKLKLTADWGRQISAYFELHKRYPKVEKSKDAKVKVNLVLNRLGHVVSVNVLESSGDPLYDEAAISMVQRSDPVPRPPAKLTDDEFHYSLDVNFKANK